MAVHMLEPCHHSVLQDGLVGGGHRLCYASTRLCFDFMETLSYNMLHVHYTFGFRSLELKYHRAQKQIRCASLKKCVNQGEHPFAKSFTDENS